MKLIKVVGFLFQFGLIGLALAVIYLVSISDRDQAEILAFLSASDEHATGLVEAGPAAFSYADAVTLSAPSVVTIYTIENRRRQVSPVAR